MMNTKIQILMLHMCIQIYIKETHITKQMEENMNMYCIFESICFFSKKR